MIIETISSCTTSLSPEYKAKFLYNFEQLYQIPILRPSLNLIVTKAKLGLINFKIEPVTLIKKIGGSCKTESLFHKMGNIFSKKHTILIKNITPEIIMHELAHAIEKESGIDLNGDFRKALGFDMKNRQPSNIQLAKAVKIITFNELKKYKAKNYMAELFARYFELLAMSYEVGGWGKYQFHYADISKYFENTTNWIEQIFNELISKKIDKEILKWSDNLVQNLKPYQKEWTEKFNSNVKDSEKTNLSRRKNWAKKVGSLGKWENEWKKFNEKNDKK